MTASDAMIWVNNGLAVLALIAIAFASWKAVSWFGLNIAIPIKDAAITHLDETNQAMKVNAKVNAEVCQTMQNLHNDVRENAKVNAEVFTRVQDLHRDVKEIKLCVDASRSRVGQ